MKTSFCLKSSITALALALLISGGIAEDVTRSLLLDAGGITEGDVKSAVKAESLTLFDAYVLALSGGETPAMAAQDYVQALARRRQAIGAFLPRISLKAQKIFPSDAQTGSAQYATGVNLYGRQPIFTGLDEWAAFKLSREDVKLKKTLVSDLSSRLLLDVAGGFYRLMQMEMGIKNREDIVFAYRKMLGELNRRVALGRSRRSEVLRTSAQVATLEAQIKSAKNELSRARLELYAAAGIPPEKPLADYETMPDAPASPDAEKALAHRPDVKAAEGELAVASARLLAARGGHLPSVYLEGTYRIWREVDPGGRDYFFALGAELPLFSGGIVSARIREAESKLKQAELKKALIIRTAKQDIADAIGSYKSSAAELEAYRKALDSARGNHAVTMNEYRLSLVTILDVLTSLTFLQGARDDYEKKSLEYKYNRVRLGVALGEFPGAGIGALRGAPRAEGAGPASE